MRILISILLFFLSIGYGYGRELTASLITCYPGPEIYELCGHTALRIRGEGIDSVWNYGIFNFNEPNFVYRFVKGETDYMVAGYPFSWFLPDYTSTGRRVVEQDLNLTSGETEKLLQELNEAALPENRRYRYNYIRDNCSTRIIDRIDAASDGKVIYPDTVKHGTFRNEMRKYHANYPWYQFGIDLALGSELDRPLNSREEMFVPVELMEKAENAHLPDGRKLVRQTRVLNEGGNAVLPPTEWWKGPLVLSWVVAFLAVMVCILQVRTGNIYNAFYFLWFFILGLAGLLVTFLVFVSVHAATSPNVLIFWLNPLQFLFCVGVCSRKTRILATIMAFYNMGVMTCLIVAWPLITQSGNPAFFPLMGATAILGAFYAILESKKGYNNNGHKRKKSVRRKRH